MRLNPDLDHTDLAARYAEHGRLQVRDVMVADDAIRAEQALLETPWSVAFNEGKTVHRLSPDQVAALTPQQGAQMMAGIS